MSTIVAIASNYEVIFITLAVTFSHCLVLRLIEVPRNISKREEFQSENV